MNDKTRKTLGYIIAVIVVAIWGETFVSSKILLEKGLRPADIFVFRFVLAYIGMWMLSFRKIACQNWKDELLMLALGVSGGSMYFLTENTALAYSTASNVAIILSSLPLATAFIIAIFYREDRMKRSQVFGSVIALLGLALIIFNGEVILKLDPLGDLLAFAAVLCWSFYSLIMRKVSGRYDIAFITRKVFGYGLLTIVPYFMMMGWPSVSPEVMGETAVWGNLVYLGLVASLGCFLAWNWALKVVGTVQTTNLIYLQPFFTMLIGYFILGETITWMAILGALILIVGMYKVVK